MCTSVVLRINLYEYTEHLRMNEIVQNKVNKITDERNKIKSQMIATALPVCKSPF